MEHKNTTQQTSNSPDMVDVIGGAFFGAAAAWITVENINNAIHEYKEDLFRKANDVLKTPGYQESEELKEQASKLFTNIKEAKSALSSNEKLIIGTITLLGVGFAAGAAIHAIRNKFQPDTKIDTNGVEHTLQKHAVAIER